MNEQLLVVALSVCVYSLLAWYTWRSWRELRGVPTLRLYVGRCLARAVKVVILWSLITYFFVGISAIYGDSNAPQLRVALAILGAVPALPYAAFLITAFLLYGLYDAVGAPEPQGLFIGFLGAPLCALAAISSAVLFLLLINIIEWWILRLWAQVAAGNATRH